MLSKTSFSGQPYNSSFEILKAIAIPAIGKYKLKFYTYVNCPNKACSIANDFIEINIKFDINLDSYQNIYRNGSEYGRFQDNEWNENTIEILIDQPLLYVCI